jgi:hypothetical protein
MARQHPNRVQCDGRPPLPTWMRCVPAVASMTRAFVYAVPVAFCLSYAAAGAQQAISTPILASDENFRDLAGVSASNGGTGFANTTSNNGVMRTGVFLPFRAAQSQQRRSCNHLNLAYQPGCRFANTLGDRADARYGAEWNHLHQREYLWHRGSAIRGISHRPGAGDRQFSGPVPGICHQFDPASGVPHCVD